MCFLVQAHHSDSKKTIEANTSLQRDKDVYCHRFIVDSMNKVQIDPVHKAFLLVAFGTFSAVTAPSTVHADETTKKTPKPLEKKRQSDLRKQKQRYKKFKPM